MKSILKLLTTLFLLSSVSSESMKKRISGVIEFTKFSDKQSLISLLSNLQIEKLKLQSNLSEHTLKCQKILDNCKNKFTNLGCASETKYKIQELDDSINSNVNALKENKDIYISLKKLEKNTLKDCKEIKQFYKKSKDKIKNDKFVVKGLQKEIENKINSIKAEIKKEEEEKKRLAAIKAKEAALKKIKEAEAKAKIVNKNKSDSKKTSEKPVTKNSETNKNKEKSNTAKKTEIKKVDKKTVKDKKIKPISFIELDQTENKGYFGNFMNKVKVAFSLLQIQPVSGTAGLPNISMVEIENKLKSLTKKQKLSFLYTTAHEFKIISKSLDKADINLSESFKDSEKNCEKRINEYILKRQISQDAFVSSKIDLEINKKKLLIAKAEKGLCDVQFDNLKLCNSINSYCEKYHAEYSEEFKEVDDLIVFFQSYIEKYN